MSLLERWPAAALGEQRLAGVELDAGLVVRLPFAVPADPHAAGRHALHGARLVEQHLGGREAGENLDAQRLGLSGEPAADVAQAHDVVAAVVHLRRGGQTDRVRFGQEKELVPGDGRVQGRALVLPVGNQLVERPRLHDRAREDMRADFRPLLDHADRDLPARLQGQLTQPDRRGETGRPRAHDDHVELHALALNVAHRAAPACPPAAAPLRADRGRGKPPNGDGRPRSRPRSGSGLAGTALMCGHDRDTGRSGGAAALVRGHRRRRSGGGRAREPFRGRAGPSRVAGPRTAPASGAPRGPAAGGERPGRARRGSGRDDPRRAHGRHPRLRGLRAQAHRDHDLRLRRQSRRARHDDRRGSRPRGRPPGQALRRSGGKAARQDARRHRTRPRQRLHHEHPLLAASGQPDANARGDRPVPAVPRTPGRAGRAGRPRLHRRNGRQGHAQPDRGRYPPARPLVQPGARGARADPGHRHVPSGLPFAAARPQARILARPAGDPGQARRAGASRPLRPGAKPGPSGRRVVGRPPNPRETDRPAGTATEGFPVAAAGAGTRTQGPRPGEGRGFRGRADRLLRLGAADAAVAATQARTGRGPHRDRRGRPGSRAQAGAPHGRAPRRARRRRCRGVPGYLRGAGAGRLAGRRTA